MTRSRAHNPGMVGIAVDMNESSAIATFAETVKNQFPDLNVLFNNAGIAGIEDYTADCIDLTRAYSTIQTNITGVVQLSAALLPTLRAQPTIYAHRDDLRACVRPPTRRVRCTARPRLSCTTGSTRSVCKLRKTSVEVLELAPPYVQTELGGPQQASDPRAMPLTEYTKEVMEILENNILEKGRDSGRES